MFPSFDSHTRPLMFSPAMSTPAKPVRHCPVLQCPVLQFHRSRWFDVKKYTRAFAVIFIGFLIYNFKILQANLGKPGKWPLKQLRMTYNITSRPVASAGFPNGFKLSLSFLGPGRASLPNAFWSILRRNSNKRRTNFYSLKKTGDSRNIDITICLSVVFLILELVSAYLSIICLFTCL